MTPQAPSAYQINERIKSAYPNITTVIGGSHPRYYQNQVASLPDHIKFDFIVPQDGWRPMLEIARGDVTPKKDPSILTDNQRKLVDIPPPTRALDLMARYTFKVGGIDAFHTITALGCPFSCHFCESGIESVRTFSIEMIQQDLNSLRNTHAELGHNRKAVMFFDDVGLMSPKQVSRLSTIVAYEEFDSWRAFTHAYLVVRHQEALLGPFSNTGGTRIGMGLETGSQRSLDLINKRNNKPQLVSDHYDAVEIANKMGIAVDAFTMIYPWEDHEDLKQTNKLVEFIANNPVTGTDYYGRPLKNHVDSTIMAPYQGTKFFDLINNGQLPNVVIDKSADPGNLYYKGINGGSGWPYSETRLPREEYELVQSYRNSFRPDYR